MPPGLVLRTYASASFFAPMPMGPAPHHRHLTVVLADRNIQKFQLLNSNVNFGLALRKFFRFRKVVARSCRFFQLRFHLHKWS